ncbi:MAG: peptidase S14 [Verrucomicrobia bacterium]|nr:MAG: peptidase S14 [Verrucomicrobiota bacterium]
MLPKNHEDELLQAEIHLCFACMITRTSISILAAKLILFGALWAQEPAAQAPPSAAPAPHDPASRELESLEKANKLADERLASSTRALRDEIAKIKLEKEQLSESLELEALKRQATMKTELAKLDSEKNLLMGQAELAKAKAEKLTHELKTIQTEAALRVNQMEEEISRFATRNERNSFTDAEPVYLKKPLTDDGILVISDRNIPLNGPITERTADFVTDRIQYWNNRNRELPIFIVIDASPGGSVMAGYRILKSMESSDAPIHVVVKSFAASMAAAITTLAEESYAYPNSVILHHQISSMIFGQLNLTEQKELQKESQRWWERLATPIANKMGITPEVLIQKMYEHSSSGDWSEFGEQAKELKWVNHVIQGVNETAIVLNPDSVKVSAKQKPQEEEMFSEQLDAEGRPFVWLPQLTPKDVYFIYNPRGYYRMR